MAGGNAGRTGREHLGVILCKKGLVPEGPPLIWSLGLWRYVSGAGQGMKGSGWIWTEEILKESGLCSSTRQNDKFHCHSP